MRNETIAFLLFAGSLCGQPALVSHVSGGAASTFTTAAINTTGATVVAVCRAGAGASLGTLSDSAGNIWVAGPTSTNNHQSQLSYVILPITSATHTFTVTGGSAVSVEIVALSGTGLLDTSTTSNGGGGSALTTIQPGNITPATTNEAFIACLGDGAAGTYSINGIFTITDQRPLSTTYGSAGAWATQATTTAQNPTFTTTNATRLTAQLLAFRPQVAGPVITNLVYTNLSANSAVFTWTTNANADSQVLCSANGAGTGTYTTYLTTVSNPVQLGVSDGWGVTSHRLGVNLPASYTGHCVVKSINQAGGVTTSADQVVTTPAAIPALPIGITSISPRYNLTTGFVDSTHGGFNGDIAHQTIGADGAWYQANNDGAGRSVCTGNNCYCCTGHNLISRWPTQFTRSMLLGMDSSTQGAPVNTVFGGGSANQAITSGTCSGNVASITIQNWQWTYPAGTPIYITGANPSTYNVSGATVLASPAPTNSTLSYTATCGSSALISGGAINLWNDGNHQLTFGIDSANGLMCINTWRANSNQYQHRVCTTDFWAHSFVDVKNHSPAAGGPTVVPGLDAPTPSQACLFGGCNGTPPILGLMQVSPCPDYGGDNQSTFPCTWFAGDENYIYYISPPLSGAAGLVLLREPYADHARLNGVDGTGQTFQEYIGGAACDDRGLYASNWTNTLTRTHIYNAGISTYGNTQMMVAAPDFHDFLLTNWLALTGINISQSSGSTIYSMCGWPWGIATPLASVNRDQTDIQFYGTFGFLVPGTYQTIDAATHRASIAFRQSGSYLNQTPNSTTNQYGSNYYTVNLADAWAGPKGNGGPRFSLNGSSRRFASNGLDLFYTFQDISGTRTITNASPNDLAGSYSSTVAQTLIQMVDRYGLYSPGFVGTCPGAGTSNCFYGTTNNTPYPFFAVTPYTAQSNDFTLAVVFNHVNSGSTGPPSGECVINRTTLKICRSTTTANSWLVTVGGTTTAALPVTCDGAGNFCGIVITRAAGAVNVYKTDGVQNTFPLTTLASFTDATQLASDALTIAAKSDGTLQFQGWLSLLAVYNRALADVELQQFTGAMRSFESARGVTLP